MKKKKMHCFTFFFTVLLVHSTSNGAQTVQKLPDLDLTTSESKVFLKINSKYKELKVQTQLLGNRD